MQARGKIAVTGATGRVGRHIVDVLEERGREVVGISRSLGVDVVTGDGLAEALAEAETVIDAATQPTPEQDAATAFFTTATHNLQEAGEQARRSANRGRVDHRHRPLHRGFPRREKGS